MLKLAIVTLALLGGCNTLPYNAYAGGNVVYVDGVTYVDHGVAYGDAPANTVIPATDPPVGTMAH